MNREKDSHKREEDTSEEECNCEVSSRCQFNLGDRNDDNSDLFSFLQDSQNVNNNVKQHHDGYSQSASNLHQARETNSQRTDRNQRRFGGSRRRIVGIEEAPRQSRHTHRSPKLRSIRTSKSCTKECDILGSGHSSVRSRRRSRVSSNGIYLAVLNAEFRLEVISDEGSSSGDFVDNLTSDEEEGNASHREVALNDPDHVSISYDDHRGRQNALFTENPPQAFVPSDVSYDPSSEDQGSNLHSDDEENRFEGDCFEEMRLDQTDSISIFLNSTDTFSSTSSRANIQYEQGSRCSLSKRDVEGGLDDRVQDSSTNLDMEITCILSPIQRARQSKGDGSKFMVLPRASSPKDDAIPSMENFLHQTCSASFETDTNCSGQSHSYVPNNKLDREDQNAETITLQVSEKESKYERKDHNDVYLDGARVDCVDQLFKDSPNATPIASLETNLPNLPSKCSAAAACLGEKEVGIRHKPTLLEAKTNDGMKDQTCADLNHVESDLTQTLFTAQTRTHEETYQDDDENCYSKTEAHDGLQHDACKADVEQEDPQFRASSPHVTSLLQTGTIPEKSLDILKFTSEHAIIKTKSDSSQISNYVNGETQDTTTPGKCQLNCSKASPTDAPFRHETGNPNIWKSTADDYFQQEGEDEYEIDKATDFDSTGCLSPRFDDTAVQSPKQETNTKQQEISITKSKLTPKHSGTSKSMLKSAGSAQSPQVKKLSQAHSKEATKVAREKSPATVHRNPDFLSFLLSLKDEKEDEPPTRGRKVKHQSNTPTAAQENASDFHTQNEEECEHEEGGGPRFPRGIESSPVTHLKLSASLDAQIRSLNVKKIAPSKKRTPKPKMAARKKTGKVTASAPKKVHSTEQNVTKDTFSMEQQIATNEPSDSWDQANKSTPDIEQSDTVSPCPQREHDDEEDHEEDRFPCVTFQHPDGDGFLQNQSNAETVRRLETMLSYLERKVGQDPDIEREKKISSMATDEMAYTKKSEAATKRRADQPNVSFRIQRVTRVAPSIIDDERLRQIQQPNTDPLAEKSGEMWELETARIYHQRWPHEKASKGPPSLRKSEANVKNKNKAVKNDEEIYIEENEDTEYASLSTHVPEMEMTYLDLLQTQANMSRGQLPILQKEGNMSPSRRSKSFIDSLSPRSCTVVRHSLRAINLKSYRPWTARYQSESLLKPKTSKAFIERPSTSKSFWSPTERSLRQNLNTSQEGFKMARNFMAVNEFKRQAHPTKSLQADDEEYWSSTVNAMLLRAEKAKLGNRLQENTDHRFPRSDSARVVHPVREKGVGFLSHLLEQDKKERKLKSNERAAIYASLGSRRDFKEQRKRRSKPTNHKSSLHYRYSNNIPQEMPLQKLPSINSGQNLVADTSSAGDLKIKTSASKAAQKRAFVTHQRMMRMIEKQSTTEPTKSVSQSPQQIHTHHRTPSDFSTPNSFSWRPLISPAFAHNRPEGLFKCLETRRPRTILDLPRVEFDDKPQKLATKVSSSSPCNFLLDPYSDVFNYYNKPFFKQRQTVLKELIGNRNTNASSGSSDRESENAPDRSNLYETPTTVTPEKMSKEHQRGDPKHVKEQKRKTENFRPDSLAQDNFVDLTCYRGVKNSTTLNNYLDISGVAYQKDQSFKAPRMTTPALCLKYGLSDDPDALTVVDSKCLTDDECELGDGSYNNLYVKIPSHSHQLKGNLRKLESELFEKEISHSRKKKPSGLKHGRMKRKHFPFLNTGEENERSKSQHEAKLKRMTRQTSTRPAGRSKKEPRKLTVTKTCASSNSDDLRPLPISDRMQGKQTHPDMCPHNEKMVTKRFGGDRFQCEADLSPHPGFVNGEQAIKEEASRDKRMVEKCDHWDDDDSKTCPSKDSVDESVSDLTLESLKSVHSDVQNLVKTSVNYRGQNSPDSCDWVDIFLKHSDSIPFPQPRDCLFMCKAKPLITARQTKGHKKPFMSTGTMVWRQKMGENISYQHQAWQTKMAVVPTSTHETDNFPKKEFLRMLRGKDLISMLALNEYRLLQSLKAVTQTSGYLPVFHLQSLDPATIVPKMFNLHFCTDQAKFGMDDVPSYSEQITTLVAFYIHESGSHSLYTVNDIPKGLYSIQETSCIPYPTNKSPSGVEGQGNVKQVNVVRFPAWALAKSTDCPKLSIIGPWSSERDPAVECQAQMFKSLGHHIEKYFLEVLDWRVTVRHGSIFLSEDHDEATFPCSPQFQIWGKHSTHEEENSRVPKSPAFYGTNLPTPPPVHRGKCRSDTDMRCYKCGTLIVMGEDKSSTTQHARVKAVHKMKRTSQNEYRQGTFIKMPKPCADVRQFYKRNHMLTPKPHAKSKRTSESVKKKQMAETEIFDESLYSCNVMSCDSPMSDDRMSEETYKLSFWGTNKIMSAVLPPPYLKNKPSHRTGIKKRFVPTKWDPNRATVGNVSTRNRTPVRHGGLSGSDEDNDESSSSTCSSSTTSSSSSSCSSSPESTSSETDSDSDCPYTHFHASPPLMSRLKANKLRDVVLKKLGEKPAASAARVARLRETERRNKEQEEFEERQQINYMKALRCGTRSPCDKDLQSFSAFKSTGTSPRQDVNSTVPCDSEFDLCPEVGVIREMWEDIFPKTNFWDKSRAKNKQCQEMYLRLGSC